MFTDKETVDFWIRLYRNMAKSLLRQAGPQLLKRMLSTTKLTIPPVSPNAFKLPISLIWGADDSFNPLWIAKDMVERLTKLGCSVTLETIADAGHFVPEEQPTKVADQISRHLKTIDPLK